MINFRLRCYNDHEFDAWFRDSQGYDEQQSQGLVSCPVCGICEVSKALTAPHILKKSADEKIHIDSQFLLNEELRKINHYVLTNFENVGENFAHEARQIAQGSSEKRGIYGKTSLQEAEDLADEGIEFFVLPKANSDA